MQDFKKLRVWQAAHELVLAVYQATEVFDAVEQYGLTSQIRRAAVSIPSNVAAGCGREGNGELHRFLHIAMGSASELEYQLLLARDLHYLEAETYAALVESLLSVKRMLNALIQKVKLS